MTGLLVAQPFRKALRACIAKLWTGHAGTIQAWTARDTGETLTSYKRDTAIACGRPTKREDSTFVGFPPPQNYI